MRARNAKQKERTFTRTAAAAARLLLRKSFFFHVVLFIFSPPPPGPGLSFTHFSLLYYFEYALRLKNSKRQKKKKRGSLMSQSCLRVPALPLRTCLHLPSFLPIYTFVRLHCCTSSKKKTRRGESRNHQKKKSRTDLAMATHCIGEYARQQGKSADAGTPTGALLQRDDTARDDKNRASSIVRQNECFALSV